MDVGESGSVPVEVEKKHSNFILYGFLIFFILAIIGLSGGLIYINFFRPKAPEIGKVDCNFKDLSEVSNAITSAMQKSESEELDLLQAYSEQCENREYKYEFLLAYIQELDKDEFGYYEEALKELDKVNFPEVPERQREHFYHTYAVVYRDLGETEKAEEYEALSVQAHKDYYGCIEGGCDNETQH